MSIMRVKILRNGRIEEHDSGFAQRLIEQGQAIPAPPRPVPKGRARETGEESGGAKATEEK